MKAIALVSLVLSLSLVACTPTNQGTTAGPAGGDQEPAAKEATSAPAETVDLLVKSVELRVEGDVVWFEPDSGVQRAAYTRYSFEKAEFEKVVGSVKPEQDVTLVIQIVRTEEKTRTPADPNSPSPDGGFRITIHHAKILRMN